MTTAAARPRLSRWTKLLHGLGEFGHSVAGGTIIPFYFLFFLTDVAGARPGVEGTLLLVARIWDAVNDPLVGALSDRTRTRLGRRRPYILAGALPLAICYSLAVARAEWAHRDVAVWCGGVSPMPRATPLPTHSTSGRA